MPSANSTASISRSLRTFGCVAALAIFPLTLAATGPTHLEKTVDATDDPEISLNNLRGQIVIHGWEKSQVHVICNTATPRVEVDVEAFPKTGRAERLQFNAHAMDPLVTANDETADCTFDVPVNASLEVRNRQGSVVIDGLQGQHASVESANAKVSASDVSSHLTARTMGGDIEVVRASGRVEVYSITGSLRFADTTSKNLRGNTNSGAIIYKGDFVPAGEYILSTYSGNIEIILPPSASFELNAKTVKGKVENTFSLTPKRHSSSPFPSANSLLGTYNTGNATVEVTSFSGRIRVHQ